ncbi:hypothetical protein [Streptomyces rubellomurinus]|uniref:DUF7691 domain-containing protein n=2 Tax=Streptomyces TaxID=1883 RepID=A0A0F2TH86_STRR3|nr:hypothetical protein [Streptomyces rubellomurinus]KJS61625.1 hypothetical protein VM95_13560 [Streptomyces rubellomurinus]
MSSFLTVYLTDVEGKHELVGCADEEVVAEVADYFDAGLARADAESADEIANGAPTAREALRAVVFGGPYDEEYGHQYRSAYRRLCAIDATDLDNRSFGPFRGRWLDVVDEGLRAHGITAVSLEDFFYGSGFPAGLPYSPDLSCGEWSPARCREALRQFESAEREGRPAPALDRAVSEAVQEVLGWLRLAREVDTYGVIGFVS